MAFEPCPRCSRRVSPQARFCVHCRAPISRAAAEIPFQRIDWAEVVQKLRRTFRNSLLQIKEWSPATRVLFFGLVVTLLGFAGSVLAASLSLVGLAYALVIYAFLMLPALLAFLLMLWRRPFG